MATKNLGTLPPFAQVEAVDLPITIDNIGGNYTLYPFVWNDTGFNLPLYYDFSAAPVGQTYGRTNMELLDQYKYVSSLKTFYPAANMLFNPSLGANGTLGGLTVANFFRLLDFWHGKTNFVGQPLKMLWVADVFRGDLNTGNGANQQVWAGVNQDLVAGERAVKNFWNAIFGAYTSTTSNAISTGAKTFTLPTGLLLDTSNYVRVYQASNPANFMIGQVTAYTSGSGATNITIASVGGTGTGITDWSIKFCSATGYTFADHPALEAIELSNESLSNVYNGSAAFARACRISYKIIKQHRPSCKVILFSTPNGAPRLGINLVGNAVSLESPTSLGAVGLDNDDGTGKQACDYWMDGIAHHPYESDDGLATTRAASIANNSFGTKDLLASLSATETGLDVACKYAATSNKLGADRNTVPLWITEDSLMSQYALFTDVRAGSWSMFQASETEKFNNLLRGVALKLLSTRDGLGGAGKYFLYAFDGSGHSGNALTGAWNGTGGAILKTSVSAHTTGEVKLTIANTPDIPFSAQIKDLAIVITAGAGGWADLGLAAGEKGEFTMSQVSGDVTGKLVYLQNTKFTVAPANDSSYTEYQIDWSPRSKELSKIVNLLTNNGTTGYVSYGWIYYPGGNIGKWVSVKNVGTWYTKEDGAVSKWPL